MFQGLRKWEYCNFHHAGGIIDAGFGDYVQQDVAIYQIAQHLTDVTTVPGRLDSYKLRTADIGGIVFSWSAFANQSPVPALSAHAVVFGALYVEKIDETGTPVNIPDFSQSTNPFVTASFAGAPNEGSTFPTRVLWRETRVIPFGEFDVGQAHPQVYYAGSRSLRLRLRLPDDCGLFFHFGIIGPATEVSVNWTSVFSGGYYWRARY